MILFGLKNLSNIEEYITNYQSIIDRVLLFKKIKIENDQIQIHIYSTKLDIPKNLILKWTNIIQHFSRKWKSNPKLTQFPSLYFLIFDKRSNSIFFEAKQLDDKKFYFILFLSSIRFYRSIFLSVTLYISPAMNWQVAVTTGEKAEWEAIC